MKYTEDFTHTAVPSEHRGGGGDILFVWMGFILVVASMSFGGGLAAQMPLNDLIVAIVAGNLVLAGLAFVTGYVGSHSGLSFSSLAAKVFPRQSWRVALLYIPICLVGWYAIEAAIFGNFIADTFGLSDMTRRLIMAAAAIFFSISAYFGMRFMGRVSYVLVPLVILISGFALVEVDSSTLSFGFADSQLSLASGIGIVISTWIFSVLLVIPDLTRFIGSPVRAGLIAGSGVFIANIVALMIGAFAAAYTRESDPSLILVGLGFTPIAILLSFAGIWSTNDNNMYSSALSVARMLNVPRKKVVLGLAAIGAIIALFNPANIGFMFKTLIFMGASAPALAGVVLGAYLYTKGTTSTSSHVLAPWLAWFGASAVAFQIEGILVVPTGIVLGFVFWVVLKKILPVQESDPPVFESQG